MKSNNKNYDPKMSFTDFGLGLRFKDLNMFKVALPQFSTRDSFEFQYMKNDKVKVKAICFANGCNWNTLCL